MNEDIRNQILSDNIDTLLFNFSQSSDNFVVPSLAFDKLRSSIAIVKRNLLHCKIDQVDLGVIPKTLSSLRAEIRKYHGVDNKKRSDRFLRLARYYAEQDNFVFARLCLADYCFTLSLVYTRKAKTNDKTKNARPYIQCFLIIYSQMSNSLQNSFLWSLYKALSLYLYTYNIHVDVTGSKSADISDKFYAGLLSALEIIDKKNHVMMFGRCLTEITIVNPHFVFDLLNKMKIHQQSYHLQVITKSLQDFHNFREDPFSCLQILARIDILALQPIFSRLELNTARVRRDIACAIIKFASIAQYDFSSSDFLALASNDTKTTLAFSILVQSFLLDSPDKESILKATLVTNILGIPSSLTINEYFMNRIVETAQLFERFFKSIEPNVKAMYSMTILNTIHSTRRRLSESLQDDTAFVVFDFFRRVESYIVFQQSMLVLDTEMELRLLTKKVPHASSSRIVLEIRNIGQGIAENLILEILPMEGFYDVEERYKTRSIEVVSGYTLVQQEILIHPLVAFNSTVDLCVMLHYDTLEKKGKVIELRNDDRSVWLYSDTEFLRVNQPYNIGQPATTWFYGRHHLLESMADNLRGRDHHDTSMIIYGLKRAGKTSVVRRFIDHTLSERNFNEVYIPIYVDLLLYAGGRLKTDATFLRLLIEVVIDALEDRGIYMSFDVRAFDNKFVDDAFATFSSLLEQILNVIDDRHILLILDEFSSLYNNLVFDSDQTLTSEMFSFFEQCDTKQLSINLYFHWYICSLGDDA